MIWLFLHICIILSRLILVVYELVNLFMSFFFLYFFLFLIKYILYDIITNNIELLIILNLCIK